MVLSFEEAYPIDYIAENCIRTNDNTLVLCYKVERQPRGRSLTITDIVNRLNTFGKAYYGFPQNCFSHKQDIFIKEEFDIDKIERNSFLGKAYKESVKGNYYIKHYSSIYFTITDLHGFDSKYLQNPFVYKSEIHEKDNILIDEFQTAVEKAINLINNIYGYQVKPYKKVELESFITLIINGFESSGYYDVNFENQTFGDNTFFETLCINNSESLPIETPVYFEPSGDSSQKEEIDSYFDQFGITLNCNHVVNQIIFFVGKEKVLNAVDKKIILYSKFKAQTKKQLEKLEEIRDVYASSDIDLCSYHFNVIFFDKDKEVVNRNFKAVKTKLENLGIKDHYTPRNKTLSNLYLGSLGFRNKFLDKDFFFDCELNQAINLSIISSHDQSDSTGHWFNDRITMKPIQKDLWCEDNSLIDSRNVIIQAKTGSGKSALLMDLVCQHMENGVNVVITEIGFSFLNLTKMYAEKAIHFEISPNSSLGNPFYIKGNKISKEKLEILTEIILRSWRVKEYIEDTHVSTSVYKILQSYYNEVQENHNIESIYNYIIEGNTALLMALGIETSFFDLKSFKHQFSVFLEGGKYENVFNPNDNPKIIAEKQLIVFELSGIKNDSFLMSLALHIIHEAMDSNILSDKSKKGVMIHEEFGEQAQIKDKFSGEDVLQTVSIINQKIRKENGSIVIVIQDFVQLPNNNFSKSLVHNSEVIICLRSSQASYEETKKWLKLSDHHFTQLQSLTNNHDPLPNEIGFSELLLKRGDDVTVLRKVLSKKELYCYNTEAKRWNELKKGIEVHGNIESALNHLTK